MGRHARVQRDIMDWLRKIHAKKVSTLESVSGLGPARRKALLRQFGGLQGVRKAGVEDLAKVNGISRVLADRIYRYFHDDAMN